MFNLLFGRRALIAGAVVLVSAGGAFAAPLAIPPACTAGAGQAELKPLQPLTLVTDKGRFAFRVEDADTYARRETGLMCRKAVAADRGMLFDFRKPTDNVAFWMRNTLIPLDIIYIRPNGRVLSIARNARPLDETPLPAGGQIRGVLELAGGRAAQIGLMPGDQVIHRIFPQ
ncbi:DUF192 domain-containing protein [Phenylobacterium sp. LjRoot225]|uniref:DUF192 domain-containing protein n=1 Tax=Phenylobacterium sp. LjRoot225 TaxID=3342285 RepID=UPI003ED0B3B1